MVPMTKIEALDFGHDEHNREVRARASILVPVTKIEAFDFGHDERNREVRTKGLVFGIGVQN